MLPQNDFLLPESPLCVKCGMACLPKVQEAVAKARANSVPIFWVIREHEPTGVSSTQRPASSGWPRGSGVRSCQHVHVFMPA
eukprot:179286-Chlamydomonas_euryale.AAC.1